MYTVNISRAILKMSLNEILYFIFENYHTRIRFGFLKKAVIIQ